MLKTIAQYTDPIQAHIAKGRLQASNIPVIIADEYYIGANWMISNAIGGVKLQVPDEFVVQAIQVIRRLDAGDYEATDLVFTEDVQEKPEKESVEDACPYCHSKDIHLLAGSWRLAFIALFLANFPFPYSRLKYQCRSCSRKWLGSNQRAYPITVIFGIGFLVFIVTAGLFYLLYAAINV